MVFVAFFSRKCEHVRQFYLFFLLNVSSSLASLVEVNTVTCPVEARACAELNLKRGWVMESPVRRAMSEKESEVCGMSSVNTGNLTDGLSVRG